MTRVSLRCLYWLSQWTIGIVQNMIGLCLFLLYVRKRHFVYHGAIVTEWKDVGTSVGMGMFVFISHHCCRDLDHPEDRETTFRKTLVHEYGHTVQSAILGPLYLLVIGIPSPLWGFIPRLVTYRREKHISYYSFYTERWANALGEYFSKDPSIGQARIE